MHKKLPKSEMSWILKGCGLELRVEEVQGAPRLESRNFRSLNQGFEDSAQPSTLEEAYLQVSILGRDKNVETDEPQVLASHIYAYGEQENKDCTFSYDAIPADHQWTKFRLESFTSNDVKLEAFYKDAQGKEQSKSLVYSNEIICKLHDGSYAKPVSKSFGFGITN